MYIVRKNNGPDLTSHVNFMDDYVAMAPLHGAGYVQDAVQVHTFLVNFIAGNNVAKAKIHPYVLAQDRRTDYIKLKDHYEGVRVYTHDIMEADCILSSVYYAGEKPLTMYWDKFKRQLTNTFDTYTNAKGRLSTQT